MITKTQKLLGGIAFLIVALFAGIVGVTALGNPKLSGSINIGYEAYEARIGRDTSYVYFSTLKSAVDGANEGEVIEIISPVSLNENITISQNLTINSMIMQGEDTQRDMAVTVGASGGFTISGNAKVNFGALAGKLSFSQLNTRTTSLFTVNSGTLEVMGGDFSGFTISGTYGQGTIFRVNSGGTLNIYGGKFNNNASQSHGGVIANYDGVINIYGGQFIANKTVSTGATGEVIFNMGILNVYGGIFKENLQGNDFAIYSQIMEQSQATNIYGGIFQENKVAIGNAINGTLNIENGTFENNNRAISNGGTFNISKSPYIDDEIYLQNNSFITFENESWIKPLKIVTAQTSGKVKIAEKGTGFMGDIKSKFDFNYFAKQNFNKYVGDSVFVQENQQLSLDYNEIKAMTPELHTYQATAFELIENSNEYQIKRITQTFANKNLVIPNYYSPTSSINNAKPVTKLYGEFAGGNFVGAFSEKDLISVLIPSTITSIGEYIFYTNKLTNIVIPDSVISIETGAFYGNQLTNVDIPNSVISIGVSAFSSNLLTTVIIPKNVIDLSGFSHNQLSSIIISNGVKNINSSAFSNNNLKYVSIPNSVISIGAGAFSNNKISSVSIGNSVAEIGSSAFATNQIESIDIPNSVINVGANAFYNNSLVDLSIGTGVTAIENSAFRNNGLTNVIIPGNVKNIGDNCFSGNLLETVTFSNGLISIGDDAFRNNLLTQIEIPASVTSIAKRAFMENNLTYIDMSSTSLTTIEESVFKDNNLMYFDFIFLPNTLTTIKASAFENNLLARIVLSSNITTIEARAFMTNGANVSVMLDSQPIVTGLTSNTAQGFLISNAKTLYIKNELTVPSWITQTTGSGGKFTLVTSDMTGYMKYTRP